MDGICFVKIPIFSVPLFNNIWLQAREELTRLTRFITGPRNWTKIALALRNILFFLFFPEYFAAVHTLLAKNNSLGPVFSRPIGVQRVRPRGLDDPRSSFENFSHRKLYNGQNHLRFAGNTPLLCPLVSLSYLNLGSSLFRKQIHEFVISGDPYGRKKRVENLRGKFRKSFHRVKKRAMSSPFRRYSLTSIRSFASPSREFYVQRLPRSYDVPRTS